MLEKALFFQKTLKNFDIAPQTCYIVVVAKEVCGYVIDDEENWVWADRHDALGEALGRRIGQRAGNRSGIRRSEGVVDERAEVEKPVATSIEIGSKIAEAAKEGEYVSVSQNGRGANIRSEPSLAAEVLRSIPPGFPLAIVERQGDWVLVEDFRERRGWVYSTLLSDPGTVVIKVGKGNLRSGPSLTDEIIAKLDYGTVMFLDETRGEWVQVSNPEGLVGWLHNEVIWP